MQGSIVDQGVELMLFGMGTVLVFLSVLVVSITLMSWILRRYFPEAEVPPTVVRSSGALDVTLSDANLVAVISAAIHKHRSKKSQ
jgi:oxaloacetate decarboxylase gamma subunit